MLAAVTLAVAVLAGSPSHQTYPLDTESVLTPPNANAGDRAQIVLDGWKRAACDEALPPVVRIDARAHTIAVRVIGRRHSEACEALMTRFTSTVTLGRLEAGSWKVVMSDGLESSFDIARGEDETREASLPAVTEVDIDATARGGWSAALSGSYADACERIVDARVATGTRAYEVVPVLERRAGDDCGGERVPFVVRVSLPDPPAAGRYLVHVRGEGGGAVSQVFSVGDLDVIGHDGH